MGYKRNAKKETFKEKKMKFQRTLTRNQKRNLFFGVMVIVPILLFIIVRKRPHILTVAASLTCLAASFVLSDIFSTGLSFGVADILNALAGIFYGVNIAFTGVFAKKFNASLYVMIQLFVQAISSMAVAVAFNFITFNGAPMDKFIFTPNPWLIIGLCGIGILTNAICWTLRTVSMKYVSANVVAVIMPFSAVVTGIFSVIFGMDTISPALIIGAAQILSLIPGTSRSGVTILCALIIGISRPAGSEFTFFLGVPVMAGASLIKTLKFFLDHNTLSGAEIGYLLIGCVVAFAVSMLAIKALMGFVKKHSFIPFGIYRIVLGVGVLSALVIPYL
jgi:undecaprenyl pyrophosphate phosphatase UppP